MLDCLQFEIYSDRVEEIFIERVLCVAQKKAGLAHTTIPNDQHFE